MVLKILRVVLVVVAAILIYAATKPSTFHIERMVTIKATPESCVRPLNEIVKL